MKNLILKKDNNVLNKQDIGTNIKTKFNKKYKDNTNEIISYISNLIAMNNDIKEIFNPEIIYRAEFPIHILEKLNTGEFEIMKSKTGELLSTIVDTTKPKNRNMVHQIRLSEVTSGTQNIMQSISNNLNNLTLQNSIAKVSEQLEEIKETLNSIKKDQVTSKLGKIYGAKTHLEQILIMDDNEQARVSMHSVISKLNEARGQLILSFEEYSNFLDNIPDKHFDIFIKNFLNKNYKGKCEEVFIEGQIMIKGIIESSILLAISYDQLGEKNVIEKVFQPLIDVTSKYSNKFCKLEGFMHSSMIQYENTWYNNPKKIIDISNDFENNINLLGIDTVSVEFSGANLIKLQETV